MVSQSEIKTYQDLLVWQKSHKLAIQIYRLSTSSKKSFAEIEIWKQVLSSAFSTPANITEGFYGHRGKGFASHLEIARGSAGETDYWLVTLEEIGSINSQNSEILRKECQEIVAMLTGLIKKIRSS